MSAATGSTMNSTRCATPQVTETFVTSRLPRILVIFACTLILLPPEASFFLAGARFPLSRILLLWILPAGLLRLRRLYFQNQSYLSWSDVLILTVSVWIVLSIWVTEGLPTAIVSGGSTALDFAGAYFAARTFLTRRGQALAFASLVGSLIAIVGLIGALDTALGLYVVHDTAAAITGYSINLQGPRFGLIRAAGPLEHPILLGTVCAFAILLGTAARGWKRWFIIGGSAIGLVASISSGPLSAAFLGIGCLLYWRLSPGFQARWIVLWLVAAAAFVPLFAIHPEPFSWILGYMAFDPATAYHRLLIWNIAGELVLNSPFFGIGITDWARPGWMPATVDSVWLRSAMSFGIPGSVMIAGCLAGACSRGVGTGAGRLTADERYLGLTLSIIMFLYLYLGFTVHFWGITWSLMGLLAGLRAHIGALACQSIYDTGSRRPIEEIGESPSWDRSGHAKIAAAPAGLLTAESPVSRWHDALRRGCA